MPKNQYRPGNRSIVSTALIAAIGNGSQFKKAHYLSAWLGLVPIKAQKNAKSLKILMWNG
ncbi:transposase [Vibrio cholerae]|nr:transposase [Vibrio cholerae]